MSITERHLQAMWLEQKYFRSPKTSAGAPIRVISPGVWNSEAGPDFKRAHLIIGDEEKIGDVEIHLMRDNWYHHNHHLDHRYNDVVLHLSLWKPQKEKEITNQAGNIITDSYLEEMLTVPLARIVQLLDLDLYPYRKFVGSGKCAHALFRSLPPTKIHALLCHAASGRLRHKEELLRSHDHDPLLTGIAMALGYKHNATKFLSLLDLYLKHRDLPESSLLALGMGACGFFGPQYQRRWKHSDHYQKLLKNHSETSSIPLTLSGIRPLNHPIRRLVVLGKLVKDRSVPGLLSKMNEEWRLQNSNPIKLREALYNLIPTYTDPYWNHHYTFEAQEQETFLPLIGKDLKTRILINTIFPLLYQGLEPKEMDKFHSLYATIPPEKNSKTKYLIHRFFGDHEKGKIMKKAQTEQGAYQIHYDFCQHYEASCEGCPFVEQTKKILNIDLQKMRSRV